MINVIKKISILFVLFLFLAISTHSVFADSTYARMGGYTIESTDGGKTYKSDSGQDVTALYKEYQKDLKSFPDFGERGTNTYTRSNGDTIGVIKQSDGSLAIEIAHPKYPALGTTIISAGADGSINTKLKLIDTGREVVLNTTAGGQTTTVTNGPTYINDGTKICDINGCTYTLMAPIGSLLGDSKGQYIINKNDQRGLCSLLNSWFRIGIALAGMLAVVMIVLGGFQYATTDSLFDKEEGKGKIQNALWGLLLALTTWLVVSTINPALANCTINAKEVQLSAMSTTIYNSGALGGGAIGVGMTMADMALQAYGGVDNSDAAYNKKLDKILEQWSINDDMLSEYNDPEALAKWDRIQAQINELNNSYSSSDRGGNGKSDNAAAQRVLDKIHSGGRQCGTSNCFEGAKEEASSVGVKYESIYQSNSYVYKGNVLKSSFGSARMPQPGEQVDYLYYDDGKIENGKYTGGSHSDPQHTVIVESIDPSTGKAVVWDWHRGKEQGYRQVTFTLNNPNQKGNVNRIYEAINK